VSSKEVFEHKTERKTSNREIEIKVGTTGKMWHCGKDDYGKKLRSCGKKGRWKGMAAR
jgi:hypothetical protein